mmetsp:Transcript_6529/g.10366  ORF Transcript_6529/g.10366 Transcript_6529/m.10366 type:complete len:189 (-) Transcript_6529:51-617(-)
MITYKTLFSFNFAQLMTVVFSLLWAKEVIDEDAYTIAMSGVILARLCYSKTNPGSKQKVSEMITAAFFFLWAFQVIPVEIYIACVSCNLMTIFYNMKKNNDKARIKKRQNNNVDRPPNTRNTRTTENTSPRTQNASPRLSTTISTELNSERMTSQAIANRIRRRRREQQYTQTSSSYLNAQPHVGRGP